MYGGASMLNKYIYMKREDAENKMYFIYQIKSILNELFPIIYECNKLYILIAPKNKNNENTVKDNLTKLELTNNDTLYQITKNEYIDIFKVFVECEGTKIKIADNIFET